ncbi:ABC transporter permease [Nonomuraea sp. LPB2021202275-12-8]|uniref:ABC transporter permease n=1 Tax=Nonomuraea sp. LPB2021202275-12-8 TaxID=3120159 RepID=UPI00300D7E18
MNALSSEWLKIRSVRSSYLIAGLSLCGILLGLGLAWMTADMYDRAAPAQKTGARLAALEEVVLIVPQLCMGIMGVLAMTSEYTTGLVRTTLAIVPKRWPVIAAKSAVIGVVSLLTGSLATFGTYFVCRSIIGDRFAGIYLVPFADKLPLLIAFSLTVPTFGLLGLGLAAILRSTSGPIVLLVSLVYVIPIIAGNLPQPWSDRLGSVMIGALPREITGVSTIDTVYGSLLSPAAAVAVLVGYSLLPVVIGAWLLRQRDA